MTLGIKGAKVQLGPKEIEAASASPRGFQEEAGALAFVRYYFGGSGVSILRKAYPPDTFGDVIYSNIAIRTVAVQEVRELADTSLEISKGDRKRGRLWFLVAISPIRPGKKPGEKVVNALIQGWWLDPDGAATKLKIPARELKEAPPVLWIGVTDEGERVEWSEAVKRERRKHLVEAAKLEEKADSRRASK